MTELKRGNGWLQSLFQEETMEEKVIEFRIHVPKVRLGPRVWKWGLAGLLVLALAENPATESITLSTYYPAPAGAYNNMVTIGNTWLARDPQPGGLGSSYVELGNNMGVANGTKLAVEGGNVLIGQSPGSPPSPLSAPALLSIYGSGWNNGVLVENANGTIAHLWDDGNAHLEAQGPGNALWLNYAENAPTHIDAGGGGTSINENGGNVAIGPGISATGGNSYVHVNGQNCYSMGQGSDNASCAGGYYATWTPGIYVETGPPWNGTGWSHTRYQWALWDPYAGQWVDAGIDCNGQWGAVQLQVLFYNGFGVNSGTQWSSICSMSSIWNGDNDWWCCAK